MKRPQESLSEAHNGHVKRDRRGQGNQSECTTGRTFTAHTAKAADEGHPFRHSQKTLIVPTISSDSKKKETEKLNHWNVVGKYQCLVTLMINTYHIFKYQVSKLWPMCHQKSFMDANVIIVSKTYTFFNEYAIQDTVNINLWSKGWETRMANYRV